MKRIVAATFVALILAVVVQAQNGLAGKWAGETKTGASVTLELTVKGTVLTGTMTNAGESLSLEDGTVAKNTFTFSVTHQETKVDFTGEFTGNDMLVWMDRQGRDRAAVLKRQ